ALSRRGGPNYCGPQRQGRDGLIYTIGASRLQDPARRARMPRAKRLWFLHAYQSFLFNRILAGRIDRLDRVLAGDWAMKHDNGACFLVEDGAVEQRRADAVEISPAGPPFGPPAPPASGGPARVQAGAGASARAPPESP